MLWTLSPHLVNSQCSSPNHGVQRVYPPDLTPRKPSGQHSFLTCRLPSRSAIFGNCLSHLFVKPEGKANYLAYATQHENDETERSGWKQYAEDKMLNSIFQSSGSDVSLEDSVAEFVDVASNSEEDPNCLSSTRQVVMGQPVNSQGNLLDKLKAVHLHILAMEQWNASRLKMCHRNYLMSASNLIHYLALRCLDVQQLKEDLSSIGLLNLETINPYVLSSITAGIRILENLTYDSANSKQKDQTTAEIDVLDGRGRICAQETSDLENKGVFTINTMREKVSYNAKSLFGPPVNGRPTHIMVTVGKEAIQSDTLISDLIKAGANVIRINCAHDDPSIWSEIIRRVKNSSQMLEKSCRILMDLAGPKIRTGLLKAGPKVMKISPKKDYKGDVVLPAQVWLSYAGCKPPPHTSPDAVLFLDDQQHLDKLEVGNILRFSDVKHEKRTLKISQKFSVFGGSGYMAECSRTAYVETGTELYVRGKKSKFVLGQLVDVPSVEQFVRLKVGDLLIISRDPCLSSAKLSRNATGSPRITCSSGRLFDSVKPGEPIGFDDGKIWGVIQGASVSEIIVSITHAGPKGSKLGSEKSINIPKSKMQFEGLTSKDLVDLEFVGANADMVGVSFIRDVCDIVTVQHELEKRNLRKLGIVLKIETQNGFEKLPLLLLQAMRLRNPLGVMIARGDLAVECGWERLADMQEEILSICNAAHIPVIWATQVLESLVKSGIPTRAEITDVANGMRACCIMLNKGKCILEAVSMLDSILHNSSKKNTKAELKPLVLSNHLNP